MRLLVFCGVQASGKSTFWREQLADTHLRLGLDMLRTRRRERALMEACLRAGAPFVSDNTNITRDARRRYIEAAREFGATAGALFFDIPVAEAQRRNARRAPEKRVPPAALRAAFNRLEPPVVGEGFEFVLIVRPSASHRFALSLA
ncbi:MAG: ATP-binding protein [Puniceicoccales bacterium]|jgi:predicted kinase|nr:ATP-binding protein [Puniceicoccales bacterium]